RAVACLESGAYMSLPDLFYMGKCVGRKRDHRLRITSAERPRGRERRKQFRSYGPRRQSAINQQGVVAPRRFDTGTQMFFEKNPKLSKSASLERDARRHGMPAALHQHPPGDGMANCATEIYARNGAPRTGAGLAGSKRYRKGGPVEPLLEPRRHQPYHTRMPTRRRCYHDGAPLLNAERRQGLGFR